MSQDELLRVFSRVAAQRQNLTRPDYVFKEECSSYDELVERAQKALGIDLEEFKVGDKHLSPNGRVHYADAVRALMDGLLNYLSTMIPAQDVQRIGFHPT
jgi:hypothetical protein